MRRSISGGRWRAGPHRVSPRRFPALGKWVWDEAADGWVPEGQAVREGKAKPVDLGKLSVNDRAEILKRRKEEEEHI